MAQETETSALLERCNEVIRRLSSAARPQGSDWLTLDIGMGEFKAMVVLKDDGRRTVGGLGRALSISEPSASLLVDKLVRRRLVDRETDPEDRRRTLVALTEDGDQLVTRLRQSRDDKFAAWLSKLGAEDLQALARGLEALAGAIEGEEGPEARA